MSARVLELRDVAIDLCGVTLVERLDLSVHAGAVTTIMGPSGCGKSSLLAFVCGTLPPIFEVRGLVCLDGVDVSSLAPEKRHIGILFQDDLLFPHMSVGENLAFGVPRHVKGRRARAALVESALAEADLAGMANRDPATLSGGQRGRIAVMRTLLAEPRALLLDEPFAKLDIALRARFRAFVFDHARRNGVPTLLVTHDPTDARSAGGAVIELSRPERSLTGQRQALQPKPKLA